MIQSFFFCKGFRHAQIRVRHCIKGAACYLICFLAFRFHASVDCTLPPLSLRLPEERSGYMCCRQLGKQKRYQSEKRVDPMMTMQYLLHLQQAAADGKEERDGTRFQGAASLGAR